MSDDDDRQLTNERIAQLIARADVVPCPVSAYCPDDVSLFRFELHVVAQRALRELQQLRASKLTEREEYLAYTGLCCWSSDDNNAPHAEIQALIFKLSRQK